MEVQIALFKGEGTEEIRVLVWKQSGSEEVGWWDKLANSSRRFPFCYYKTILEGHCVCILDLMLPAILISLKTIKQVFAPSYKRET